MIQGRNFQEPEEKRSTAFFDGQNLYHQAKKAFGHPHPNYDPEKLHDAICKAQGWQPSAIRFYTGVPRSQYSKFWHGYWSRRLSEMNRTNISVTSLPLDYHPEDVILLDGSTITFPDGTQVAPTEGANGLLFDVPGIEFPYSVRETRYVPNEKGIDIRLALDAVRLTQQRKYDVAIIFSQDQDFAQLVEEVKAVAKEQKRWIKLVCAFPDGTSVPAIRGCEAFPMDEAFYNKCLDPRDYRPKGC